jgi:hypothetical protein
MMRNIWYPKKMAEYMTAAKMQELGVKKDATVERDGTFGSKGQRKLEKKQDQKTEKKSQDPARIAVEKTPVAELEPLSVRDSTMSKSNAKMYVDNQCSHNKPLSFWRTCSPKTSISIEPPSQ